MVYIALEAKLKEYIDNKSTAGDTALNVVKDNLNKEIQDRKGAAWRLEPGTVMTDEPGLYFIPALIDKCRAEGLYKGIVDYDALELSLIHI